MATSRTVRSLALGAATALLAGTAAVSAAVAVEAPSFTRTATYPVYLNVPAGVDPLAETVAEISTVTPDGETLIYTDALGKRVGFVDIRDAAHPQGLGTVSLADLGHADDQPTSVAAFGEFVLVVIDETGGDFVNPSGRLDVLRVSDRAVVATVDLGGQPDSIAISPDKKYAAIAIENQRDEEFTPEGGEEGDLPQAPAGFIQVIELDGEPPTWAAAPVALPAEALAGLDTPEDAEPEYVAMNGDNKLAENIPENNGIANIDLPSRAIERVFSAGSVDLEQIDTADDGIIALDDSLSDIPREPDAIAWIGDDHLATANEGDWKGGSRGWTVFDVDGDVVWDAGNSIEHLAVQHGLYNDDRADNKGAEIEGLAVAEFDGTTYAFVASERANFVAVYDVDDPTNPSFVQLLFSTNGPEGILPIPARGLLVVSSEADESAVRVRAAVNLYELGAGEPQPTIVSDSVEGLPIGWTALGALSGDPIDADTLYSATDAALAESQLYTIDVSGHPARITSAIAVTRDGAPVGYDIEGLFARPQGGFWLASEGATGAANQLVRTDDAGVVLEEIPLPADVTSHIRNWGLEGVTATTDEDGVEIVYVAVQRPLWIDPTVGAGAVVPLEGASTTRIGRYDVATGGWAWLGYQLESTSFPGDWMGLSEIVAVDEDTLAVIERDKLNGPDAAVKRVYSVELPSDEEIEAAAGAVIPVEKTLAVDVLPALRSFNSWTQEKLEGLTIAADGQVYAITDNDGLADATGETQFIRLGAAAEIFPADDVDPEPTAEPTAEPTTQPTASPSPTRAGGSLAVTGTDAGQWIGIAALAGVLAVIGATLVIARRRKA